MRRLATFLFALLALLSASAARAQIVNRLGVDDPTFQRYAWGRMQQYNPDNLALADSLYGAGAAAGDYKRKCLGLSLEFPVRFAQGDYGRMDEAVAEIKRLLASRPDARAFYYAVIHEYCQYLIYIGRASDAMLEARAMERLAGEERSPLGKMYAHRIVGQIHSYRTNAHLAIQNYTRAADYCQEAHAEQELPNLYILIAQEYIRLDDFRNAARFCDRAGEYQEFFPALRVKVKMTRALLYNAMKRWRRFWRTYDELVEDPLYRMQTDADARYELDIAYLLSKERFDEALAKADSLGTARGRHERKHAIYAAQGAFEPAYAELARLMAEKDSIYIRVQDEDLAILDAEMNNARLRQDAERLKGQNRITILVGFVIMFALAFLAMLFSQWRLRHNLDMLKLKDSQMLLARRAYQKALDAKEAENAMKIKILQNRKSKPFQS